MQFVLCFFELFFLHTLTCRLLGGVQRLLHLCLPPSFKYLYRARLISSRLRAPSASLSTTPSKTGRFSPLVETSPVQNGTAKQSARKRIVIILLVVYISIWWCTPSIGSIPFFAYACTTVFVLLAPVPAVSLDNEIILSHQHTTTTKTRTDERCLMTTLTMIVRTRICPTGNLK